MGGVIWLLFFDDDSVLYQFKLNKEIHKKETENERLKSEIEHIKQDLKKINDPVYLEKYAREELWLRKPNEDIYLIDEQENE